jgi:hypothetical protein
MENRLGMVIVGDAVELKLQVVRARKLAQMHSLVQAQRALIKETSKKNDDPQTVCDKVFGRDRALAGR